LNQANSRCWNIVRPCVMEAQPPRPLAHSLGVRTKPCVARVPSSVPGRLASFGRCG
jgi:hypothetical protein